MQELRIVKYTKDPPKKVDIFLAHVLINPNDMVIKDTRGLKGPREATEEELAAAIVIERESGLTKLLRGE